MPKVARHSGADTYHPIFWRAGRSDEEHVNSSESQGTEPEGARLTVKGRPASGQSSVQHLVKFLFGVLG